MTWKSQIINRSGAGAMKSGDIVRVWNDDDFPEVHFEIKAINDRLIIEVMDHNGKLLTAAGVKQRYPRW